MLISILVILIAITVHEFAHAWVADRLGDPTAKLEGRLTLNPLAHLDPLGTLLFFYLIFIKSPIIFGWGKPVPIDPYNLRSPRRDQALIALAGPLSNIILAVIVSFLYKLAPGTYLASALLQLMIINLGLALFNLLPLNPLDGSKVILGFLPFEKAEELEEFLRRYSLPILILSFLPIFMGNSLIDLTLFPLLKLALRLLL